MPFQPKNIKKTVANSSPAETTALRGMIFPLSRYPGLGLPYARFFLRLFAQFLAQTLRTLMLLTCVKNTSVGV